MLLRQPQSEEKPTDSHLPVWTEFTKMLYLRPCFVYSAMQEAKSTCQSSHGEGKLCRFLSAAVGGVARPGSFAKTVQAWPT